MRKTVLVLAVLACGSFTGCGMLGNQRDSADIGPMQLGSEAGMASISASDTGSTYQQYATYREQTPPGETQRVATRGPIGRSISTSSYYSPPATACSSGC